MLPERIVALEVGEPSFTGLRIQFEIKSGYQNQVKRALFSVYNMSDNSRNQLESDQPVRFSVLDKDLNLTMTFYGFLSSLSLQKEQDGSIVTKLYCWSGNSDYIKKKRSVSFDKGATGQNVMDWIKKSIAPIEVNISADAKKIIDSTSYPKGYKLDGSMGTVIRTWGRDIGINTCLEDTQLFFGEPGIDTFEVNAVAKYGMIGIPSITIQGIQVSTELNPTPRISDLIDVTAKYYTLASSESDQVTLNNRSANGIYKIIDITHQGDTHSPRNWSTTYEGLLSEQTS